MLPDVPGSIETLRRWLPAPTLRSAALVALIALTSLAVGATTSPWLVPPYLVAMGWLLLTPAPSRPVEGEAPSTESPSSLAESSHPGPEEAPATLGPGVEAEAVPSPAEPPRPRKSRARGKGKAKAKAATPAERPPATWVQIAPGKFVRVEQPPTAPVGEEGEPVAEPATTDIEAATSLVPELSAPVDPGLPRETESLQHPETATPPDPEISAEVDSVGEQECEDATSPERAYLSDSEHGVNTEVDCPIVPPLSADRETTLVPLEQVAGTEIVSGDAGDDQGEIFEIEVDPQEAFCAWSPGMAANDQDERSPSADPLAGIDEARPGEFIPVTGMAEIAIEPSRDVPPMEEAEPFSDPDVAEIPADEPAIEEHRDGESERDPSGMAADGEDTIDDRDEPPCETGASQVSTIADPPRAESPVPNPSRPILAGPRIASGALRSIRLRRDPRPAARRGTGRVGASPRVILGRS